MNNLDVTIDLNNFAEKVFDIALKIRPNWKLENLKIVDLKGGITNKLVACYSKDVGLDSLDTLLLRLYGEGTADFISRDDEISTMKIIKKCDLGPEFYCKFNNGICYQYLPGDIVNNKLIDNEKVCSKIAEALAKMHFLDFNGLLNAAEYQSKFNKKPFIFPRIRLIMNLVKEDYKAHMPHMTDEFLKTIPSHSKLKQEIDFLENFLTDYTNKHNSVIVFSHNDLLLGNIIYNNKDDSIKFIDYEYAEMNYQAYDIANHFNEFAGVDAPDYKLFPSKDYQMKWVRVYLNKFSDYVNEYYKYEGDKKLVVTDERVEQFYKEVNKFTLASHFMWATWSLVQAQNSSLDFNFVNYAQIRFDEYFRNKEAFVNL